MTLVEVNRFLARAGLLDARMKRTDVRELSAMVEEWQGLLADVSYADALDAMRAHYSSETRTLMAADVLALVGVRRETADDVARAEWLEARGLTEAQLVSMPRAELEALVRGEVRHVGAA